MNRRKATSFERTVPVKYFHNTDGSIAN